MYTPDALHMGSFGFHNAPRKNLRNCREYQAECDGSWHATHWDAVMHAIHFWEKQTGITFVFAEHGHMLRPENQRLYRQKVLGEKV